MKPRIARLERYLNNELVPCRYCQLNPSIGRTSYGLLGCRFCQKEVDDYIESHYQVVYKEEGA